MYAPYFIFSYMIGILVYLAERPSLAPGAGLAAFLFPRDIWLHRSAQHDYAIALINYAIAAALLPQVLIHYEFFSSTLKGWTASPHESAGQPGAFVIVIFTLLSFMLSDLFYYWSHRLTHRINWLWEFHKLHHSAEIMTPVTLHRAHPVDVIFNVGMRMMGLALASAAFYYFYPTHHGLLTITGTNVFLVICYIAGANLRHSHLWLSYGPRIERVMMSPAQHQIHHSTNPAHFNRNYGADMSLWDWVFGSLYLARDREEVTFGLGAQHDNTQSLWGLYLNPFRASARAMGRSLKRRLKKVRG